MSEGTEVVREGSRAGAIWGFLVIVLGMICIAVPWIPGLGVTLMIGIVLLVTGIAQTFYAFSCKSFGKGVLRFVFGVLAALAGLSLVSQPGAGLATITLFLAAWFVADGIWSLISGFKWRPFDGWGWMVFSGIVSIVLGVMIYRQYPESAIWLVGVLVGIRLVLSGWTMVAMGVVGEALADRVDQAVAAKDSGNTDGQL